MGMVWNAKRTDTIWVLGRRGVSIHPLAHFLAAATCPCAHVALARLHALGQKPLVLRASAIQPWVLIVLAVGDREATGAVLLTSTIGLVWNAKRTNTIWVLGRRGV